MARRLERKPLFAVAVTVGAFVYNVSADLVGGIEVTLSERD